MSTNTKTAAELFFILFVMLFFHYFLLNLSMSV